MSMADTLAIVLALSGGGTSGHQQMDLPPPAPEVTIEDQNGGHVRMHAYRVIGYGDAGSHLRVLGRCVSACTLILALPRDRICVGPNAAFGFHQPSRPIDLKLPITDLGSAIEDTYPPFVKQWLKAKFGGLPAGRPRYMRYDLLKQHYPTCG